ncbi:Spc97-Spc98 domain containing protein [Pyrenophora tritici-repentis]|uniref:Spindle pole body component n=1 Tax=Pyrenophora tritici-repentis TaxID=45151 RepID=A0A922SSP9_9PLEO|nr:Spc97-Spc98 domain containing protein [Pyrenophora tritici-repentis]
MEADDSIYNVNVFSTDDLWRQPTSFEDADTRESFLFAPLELDISSIKFDHPYAPKHTLERELRLPDLDTFEFGPLPDLESLDGSTISIDTLPLEPEEDVWETARKQGPANKHVLFYTWQSFEKGEHLDSPTPFLTERGPEVFDATLVRHEESDNDKPRAGRILKGHVLLQSLWNLGLARSSILFRFNPKLKTFESAVPDGRASGLTLLAAQSLTMYFIHIGSTFLYLRSFAERTFSSATAIAAKVALATSVSSVLSSLEDTLGKQSAEIRSLLQLQHQFARPREILMHVARMVDAAKHAKTNEQLSSILHHRLLELEEGDEHLRQLSCQVLCQVARPSLELLGEWMGIRKEDESAPIWQRNSFVAVEDPTVDPPSFEYSYKSEMMPRFISPEDGNTIFETGNSLRFLKTQHPQHPLARLDGLAVQPPDMEWGFAWQDIETLSSKAKAYEERLRRALLAYSARTTDVADALPMPSVPEPVSELPVETQHLDRYFEDSIESMNAPPKWAAQTLPDELQLLVGSILNTTEEKNAPFNTFSPPMSLASTLSFRPLITAQAKLVNAATVRLFFRSHQLRLHLSLQRQYHLLGDGVFSSLLATALFDPNRESAERHKGRMRSGVQMGLQLGSRKSWPPASSELRLALRGVLSESYYSSALYQTTLTAGVAKPPSTPLLNSRDNDELPGQLNFAIRNLTEAEQEKVMDPDALHALDFLRLQYVAPTPLNLVITTSALDKYDYIFKFLLRLLRMLFVVAHLPRSYTDTASRQFRAEAYHFVVTLTNYVFQTGIAEPWADFDAFVATVERRLNEEDEARELGVRVTQGVSSLRDAHEACLDSILFALLLRKRQRKIMGLVEEVFEHILLFAKMQNAGAQEERFGDETVKGLYAKLRGKVRVFLSVCRGLTGKQGYGVGRGTREENQMERLVVGMEMNGYFAAS